MVWYNNNQGGAGTVKGECLEKLRIVVLLVKHCVLYIYVNSYVY